MNAFVLNYSSKVLHWPRSLALQRLRQPLRPSGQQGDRSGGGRRGHLLSKARSLLRAGSLDGLLALLAGPRMDELRLEMGGRERRLHRRRRHLPEISLRLRQVRIMCCMLFPYPFSFRFITRTAAECFAANEYNADNKRKNILDVFAGLRFGAFRLFGRWVP